MVTLLIVACLLHTDNCRPIIVAEGMVNERQCNAYAPLMILGWGVQHPEAEVERGLCTQNPAYIIGRFQS